MSIILVVSKYVQVIIYGNTIGIIVNYPDSHDRFDRTVFYADDRSNRDQLEVLTLEHNIVIINNNCFNCD